MAVSDRLGEHPDRRSEPDVIALWRDVLVFILRHDKANSHSSPRHTRPGR